jgi:small conductance mechanosensitive channel
MSDASTQDMIQTVLDLLVPYGLKVVGAIVLLLVGRMVAGGLRKGVRSTLTRRNVDETLIPFVSGIVYYLALAVVLIAFLGLFGIETTSLVAVLGAAGLAIGLALQGTLSNFAAGVMLLIFRPFKPGDFVEAGGSTGSVKEIGIFTTTLASPDNKKIILPNASAFGGTITNYSAYGTRRNDMVIGISYDDDISRAIEMIHGILGSDERVLKDPEPLVAVGGLGDSSVDLVVRPWCDASDYWGLRADVTRRIKEELEAAGCSIPYPQRDLHVLPPPA